MNLLAPTLLSAFAVALVQPLLDEPSKVSDAAARRLLSQVVQRLRSGELDEPRRADALRQLVRLVPLKARTPEEVLEVFGAEARRSVSRQILFRRYVEQWTFEPPVPVTVSFDCPLGREPQLKSVTWTPR